MFQGSNRPKGAIKAARSGAIWQLHDDKGQLAFGDTPIELPSAAWCRAIITEWPSEPKAEPDPQRDSFNLKPDRPATQVAQLALLGTAVEAEKYQQQLLDYLATDTILFWQESPSGLMQAQRTHWQPILYWIQERFGDCPEIRFDLQPAQMPENLRESLLNWLKEQNAFCLAGLIFLTGITGSIMLSTALAARFLDSEAAYQAACLEALYQRARWGADAEGDSRLDRVRKSCILATDFLQTDIE